MRSAVAKATAPPEPPSPMTTETSGTPIGEALLGGAGDRLGLAALLGALAGVGAGGVDQGDDREVEAVGEVHEADRLAVALGAGHAEVAGDARAGVVALLVADHHHGAVVEAGEAAHDRVVVGEGAVAGERRPFAEEARRCSPGSAGARGGGRPASSARGRGSGRGRRGGWRPCGRGRRPPRPRWSRRSCGPWSAALRPCPRSRRGPFRSRDRSASGAPAGSGEY